MFTAQGVEDLARELEAERLSRCSKEADIHDRIGREVSDLGRRLEEQYRALAEAIAEASDQMDTRRQALEKVVEQERQHHTHESNELRALLDTVWQRASTAPAPGGSEKDEKSYYFRFEETSSGTEYFKEVVGDQEDINTLYEMVREALGDTVSIRQEVGEEREDRRKDVAAARQQLERLERQLSTVQSLLQTAASESAPSEKNGSRAPLPSTSPGVEPRRVRRDPSAEAVKSELTARLEDHKRQVLARLEEQLAASRAAQEVHRSEILGLVEAKMAEIREATSARVEISEESLRREVQACVEEEVAHHPIPNPKAADAPARTSLG